MSSTSSPLKHRAAVSDSSMVNRSDDEVDELKQKLKKERADLVLWKNPAKTFQYFMKELAIVMNTFLKRILSHRKFTSAVLTVIVFLTIASNIMGPHQSIFRQIYKEIRWCLYWIGLGILSSVGFGTGLHTFLLYLGPHIVSVILAAYECGSLDFPDPPYPDQIMCPEKEANLVTVSIWSIMQKVKIESIMWGAGVAIGELPPYFMGRAACLSDYDSDNEHDLKSIEELQKKSEQTPDSLTLVENIKLGMERMVKRLGFYGILICASFPNPLFDLLGFICGHFGMPFWMFFGATFIGKAFIKITLQVFFIIIAFNQLLETALNHVRSIPVIGVHLQPQLIGVLENQKKKLRSKGVVEESPSIISKLFDYLLLLMFLYYGYTIVNSMAQSYHTRVNKKQLKEE